MKLGTKWRSKALISNFTIVFINSIPKIPFGANSTPKLQIALKRSTKGYSRGLISNSTIVILNSAPKIAFFG